VIGGAKWTALISIATNSNRGRDACNGFHGLSVLATDEELPPVRRRSV